MLVQLFLISRIICLFRFQLSFLLNNFILCGTTIKRPYVVKSSQARPDVASPGARMLMKGALGLSGVDGHSKSMKVAELVRKYIFKMLAIDGTFSLFTICDINSKSFRNIDHPLRVMVRTREIGSTPSA